MSLLNYMLPLTATGWVFLGLEVCMVVLTGRHGAHRLMCGLKKIWLLTATSVMLRKT